MEFNDYVQPNLALADGSLDANFFQHEVYFNQFKGDRKLDLKALVQGPIAPMGVYSKQRKSLADLKEGDKVALPNDPSNLARGLLLLQQAGLVKLKEGVNPLRVSELDLAANPKKIKLLPLDAAHLPRSLDDAQYAIINGQLCNLFGLEAHGCRVAGENPGALPERGGRENQGPGRPMGQGLGSGFPLCRVQAGSGYQVCGLRQA